MARRTVKKGDYLIKIARQEGITLKELIEANPQIEDPNLIYPGDSINIPGTSDVDGTILFGPLSSEESYGDTRMRTMQDDSNPFNREEGFGSETGEPTTTPGVSKKPESKRYIKGKYGSYHKEYEKFIGGNNGLNENILSEPVPQYYARPGDGILSATGFTKGSADNNTMIVMGRDRNGLGEIDSANKKFCKSNSGYSTNMGAGAIDIVVGRMSPFPLELPGKTVGPCFNYQKNKKLNSETLEGIDGITPFFTNHTTEMMDASRIYISQMTDIDINFRITRQLLPGSSLPDKRTPCSGIMLKADKARIHARQDIKIVTGGKNEPINSQGNTITQVGGIHLIAGNQSSKQQPIPKGDNLARVLDDLITKVNQLSNIVFTFANEQLKFNNILGTHCHQSPMKGISTTPSLTAAPKSVETVLNQLTRVNTQLAYLKGNLGSSKGNYLKYGSAHYINSDYNTTN